MDEIRIEGLRSLRDTGLVSLKPITILVGNNSSGKSTFLRAFPLLRQSVEKKTRGPILWNGSYTDFESFDTSLHKSDNEDNNKDAREICFTFKIPARDFRRGYYTNQRYPSYEKPIEIDAKIFIRPAKDKKTCYTHIYDMSVLDHKFSFTLDEDGVITDVSSSKITWPLKKAQLKYQQSIADSLLPVLATPRTGIYFSELGENDIVQNLFTIISDKIKLESGSSSDTKCRKFTRVLVENYGDSNHKLKLMKLFNSTAKWTNRVQEWSIHDEEFQYLSSLIDLVYILRQSFYLNQKISEELRGVRYVAPIRASTARYYRYQDLSVDELDHLGENIGMFLSNIPKRWKKTLDEWTSKKFNFVIDDTMSMSHVAIGIRHSDSRHTDNVADMGFGYSQILPIIIQLWAVSSGYEKSRESRGNKSIIFAIEQPELHLHPLMQANLSVAFSESVKLARENKIDLRIILETHSPSLISKLGDLIATNEFDNSDCSVILFEKQSGSRETQLKYSYFNNDGELKDWPVGFFHY
ncbi:AAA family ATPase [Lacimicrobium alkaliphilum]|uniref:Endonuclease GajA/Old nuclease/RecF-like AAA domain-containing protein n=1 Tax=Lacimicrobium alkaliphilum TaxID=1526571 RepID=A0A0U3AE29_9ALTE|nr:AAA family ATPase [Lacimicrobium alkaliphilum]ALS99310.1 hypothetical protein AT746_14290 [Lacimicrobium alkaliphilum]